MDIGRRITSLREEKELSQGDIEKRTGLLRCYISRVENGHTVPAIETLEKIARALEMPLYQLMMTARTRQPYQRMVIEIAPQNGATLERMLVF
jgi:transcriptional regulator with XRE-family HTH domain